MTIEKILDAITPLEQVNKINEIIDVLGEGSATGLPLLHIGQALYVDESKGLDRYLNGQVVEIGTQYTAFLNELKIIRNTQPNLFTTEENWQAAKTASHFGQVGQFVIADDESTVRLPAIVNLQGVLDLQNAGLTVEAGLPNITGMVSSTTGTTATYQTYDGCFTVETLTGGVQDGGSGTDGERIQTSRINIDASLSNSIYGNNETVQQEAVQYPYFIRIATGQETIANITNELTTNNPYSLFDYKYSDHELYNASWIKGTTVFYPKSVYVTAYEALQVEYNTEVTAGTEVTLPSGYKYVKQGLSVKLSTETFTDYDFVLDTANESFRPKLKVITADIRYLVSKKEPTSNDSSWYRIYSDGWCEQGGRVTTAATSNVAVDFLIEMEDTNYAIDLTCIDSTYNEDIKARTLTTTGFQAYHRYATNASWSVKGYMANPDTQQVPHLYFFVGDTVQNASLIDAGRVAEQIADIKSEVNNPSRGYLVESYESASAWYRKYSDGWIEQGGYIGGNNTTDTDYNITFPMPFTTKVTSFSLSAGTPKTSNTSYYVHTDIGTYKTLSNTGFTMMLRSFYIEGYWYANGR